MILENFYPRIGGVETLFLSLAKHLDQYGHQVTLLTNQYDPSLKKVEIIGENVTVIRKRYYNRYLFTFVAWWHAIGLARKADVVHTTSYNAAVPARIAAKITSTPSIITFHERYGELWDRLPWMTNFSKRLHKTFESWICGFGFDRFVAVSDATKLSLIKGGVAKEKINRIYNGISYQDFPKHEGSDSDTSFTFLFYGRLGYAKGVDILLKAYAILLHERVDHRLVMIIPSEEQPTSQPVKDLMSKLELDDKVQIRHDLPYEELTDAIAKSDAVIIPSYSEGFCFAAAETMAIGTPIISSGQGALAEVVSGKHITSKRHDPQALSEAMSDAMKDKWTITDQKRFELSDLTAAYIDLYQALL